MTTHLPPALRQGLAPPLGAAAPNAALLIDFDNVTMGMRSDLSKDLKKLLQSDIIRGKVTVQRAYADWRRYPQYIVPLSEASIDLIFAPAYGSSKKNATDIRMAIDGMELVFTRPEIGTYILLTGDSDFSSLVLKLKEYGKYVIGVGIQESSSDILVQNCDEYYSYTTLTGLRKSGEEDRQALDPWVLVERAVAKMIDRGDVMRSDRLKQVMIEVDPGFDEGNFGYSKFSRFLTEAASKGLVALRKLENGQYEVGSGGDGDGKPKVARDEGRESKGRGGRDSSERGRQRQGRARPTPAPKEESPGAPPPRTEEEGGGPLQVAYRLLRRAQEALEELGRKTVRDSDVKRKMLELEASFDEAQLGFPKFSRFLRQAHDDGIVEIRALDGGNYEVAARPAPKDGDQPSTKPPVERAEGGGPPRGRPQERGRPAAGSTETSHAAPDGQRTKVTGKTEQRSESTPGRGLRRGSTRRRREHEEPPPLLEGQAVPLDRLETGSRVDTSQGAQGRVDVEALGLPTDAEAQIRYLTNSYRGIGRKTAESLVERFGKELFSVLEYNPKRLDDVVPPGRAEQVLAAWRADFERRRGRGAPASSSPPTGADETSSATGELGPRTRGGGRPRSGHSADRR